MYKTTERRTILKYALGAGAALSLPAMTRLSLAQNATDPALVRGTVYLLNAGGTNVLVGVTPAGLVLVDSGTATYSNKLLTDLSAMSDRGVHTLFNTHWHAEHCGGNELIGNTGATIIAHRKTWHHLSTEYYLPHEERYHRALPAAALPTVTFHDRGSVEVGGTSVDYGALVEPHTDADIFVYFRDANVLAAGGAVSPDHDPELDWYGGGWLGGRVDSMSMLVDIANDDTLIVPAQGRVVSKAELVTERDIMQEVYNRVWELIRAGCSAECMEQEGALTGLGRTWQDPQRFLYSAYKGMWAHHYNLAPDIL